MSSRPASDPGSVLPLPAVSADEQAAGVAAITDLSHCPSIDCACTEGDVADTLTAARPHTTATVLTWLAQNTDLLGEDVTAASLPERLVALAGRAQRSTVTNGAQK